MDVSPNRPLEEPDDEKVRRWRAHLAGKGNFLLLSLLVVVVDQWSKWLIEIHLPLDAGQRIIPHVLNFIHVTNTGVAFGLFPAHGQPLWTLALTLVGFAALAAVLFYFWSTPSDHRLLLSSLSLILGGAVGNLIDRIATGAVTDFIDVYWRLYHWHTFNVADSAITIGIVLMAWDILRGGAAERRPEGTPVVAGSEGSIGNRD
ncbi:MAG TPA: signal peptidase II [Thermoanaerobaculia bacterium]|nr:signal peptidase II [Thermoanaerobaculia bacterium]